MLVCGCSQKVWFVVALSPAAQSVKGPIMKNKTAIQNQNHMTTLISCTVSKNSRK